MSDELKPCPFCGSRHIEAFEGSTFRWGYLACADCGGTRGDCRKADSALPADHERNIAAFAEDWNHRTLIAGTAETGTPPNSAPTPPPVQGGGLPTTEDINALPEPVRRYIAALETMCDPAGLVRENAQLKDTNRGLQAMYRRALADGVPAQDGGSGNG